MAINVNVNGNTAPLEAAVQAAVNRIRKTPIKITVDDKGATQPLGNMRRSADEFSKSMEAANARIIAFGASMAIINGVADAFKGMVKNVVEVEKALADINVVMGLSAQNLERFSDGLFTVAKETGQAFKIAADAATEYARQGLSMEESLKRTKDALILTRLTGMDSANAVKSLTAAMNTYGNQIKDTTELVSKFAAVDVKFAVSAEDFADAIARTGAAARGAGVDIDELIGLVTAAQQQTARGGKVIGNSFKTIFTRIGRTDTLNQLENLGIAVRDVEGNTLGAKRILTDLANTFDNLTEAQKAQIAQTVGGVFQINVLKAVLGDAAKQNGILANATQISAGATDEAITKNEQLRLTMAAMATETGLAIKEVSAKIGEIALAPGMEKILNVVKSVAEGANNLLGDGESAGGKFANGFLKGLGNIITGPGLVVIVAVFGKLFLKAAQYARESLTSLIGVTTEAQKQKAIQTSLVGLFGQSAALSKEMLRTDISRTEKEKIILALLKAQVAEANVLNAVSKQAASTLYRQGFGANLAPRGRSGSGGGRAGGHVPNFAEREQAAKGGYAAGNIRTMNMPGQGSVIYNSAEKVKNFAGMKQPAIMPPLSSKAGKNYQQAFGSVHGFDPYAGSGFVPNFNAGLIDARHVATMLIPFEGFGRKLSGGGKGVAPAAKGGKSVFGQKINSKILFNMLGVKRGGYAKSSKDNQGRVVPKALSELGDVIGNQTVKIANQLNLGNNIEKLPEASGSEILKKFLGPEGGRSGAKGAISGLYGAVFEEALSRRLKTESTERDYMGGDFDVRMATPELKKLFGPMAPRGDYKISDGRELQASMSSKIAKEVIFRGAKGSAPKLKMAQQMTGRSAIRLGGTKGGQPGLMSDGHIPNYAAATLARFGLGVKSKFQMAEMIKNSPFKHQLTRYGHWKNFPPDVKKRFNKYLLSQGLTNKTLQSYGFLSKNSKSIAGGLGDFLSADGHVPNFANPLADAVNREKGAGVPVSQIRVGSHQALMNKGNPLGLGVTNTTDEPNGLRDVFGANGYVPNYAFTDSASRIIGNLLDKWQKVSGTVLSYEKKRELVLIRGTASSARESAEDMKQLGFSKKQTSEGMRQLGYEKQETREAMRQAGFKGGIGSTMMNNARGGFGGNFGMMAMMGAPMVAGFLQGDGPGQTGAGAVSYAGGGALTGAASGGMMAAMVAPFFGPAAPLVIVAGTLGGALYGATDALTQNTDAINENIREQNKALIQSENSALGSAIMQASQNNKAAFGEASLENLFGSYKPNPGESFGESMYKLSVPEATRKKLQKGEKKFDEEDFYRTNVPEVQQFLKIAKKDALVRTEIEKANSMYVRKLKEFNEKIAGLSSQLPGGKNFNVKNDVVRVRDEMRKLTETRDRLSEEVLKRQDNIEGEYSSKNPGKLSQLYAGSDAAQDKAKQFLDRSGNRKSILKSILSGSENVEFDLDKKGIDVFGKEGPILGKEIINALDNIDPSQLELLFASIAELYLKQEKTVKDSSEALILQLNIQNAMAQAQQATVLSQLDIKSNYANMANQTKMQAAFMGKFISEEQKVRNKYILAVNKAKESFESGSLVASGTLKTNILQDVAQNKSLESALKNEMFNDKEVQETLKVDKADDITKADLTLALAKMENEKLLEILTKIGVGQDEANKIVKNRLLLYDGSIDKLQKQNELSLKQAANEKSINMVLAQRKTLLDDMTDRIEEFNRKAAFNAERGAIEKAISDAQIKGTGYISADEQLARDRADMNNRIIPDMRAQGKGKSLEALKALGVGFNEDEQAKIMKMAGDDLDITSIVKEQREREFKKANEGDRMSSIQTALGANKKLSDKEFKDLVGGGETSRQDMEAELAKLKTLDEQRTKLSKDLTDEIDEANTSLKRQNILNEGNVKKVKEEMLARERMRERMTGSGAAGFGFEDGMDEMRDRIKTMDYELTKSIPQQFANGLSNAMIEAINGAKDLDDALREAGLGFLKMIQQAMMQKLAMQAVSALGFSQGGGVRKYSSGGNVPAMVTNGEYVMGRSAAKKYGGGFMHSLNARGKVPNYSMGGDTMQEYGMGKIPGYRKGGNIQNRKFKEKQMSGFFYSGQSGNLGLREASEDAQQVVSDRREAIRKAKAEAERKKQKRRERLGLGLSIVGMGLVNHAMSGGFSDNVSTKHADGVSKSPGLEGLGGSYDVINSTGGISQMPQMQSQNFGDFNSPFQYEPRFQFESRGGKIGKYAGGGMINGKSGIDQIPAMLSEGEYVIKASSARQLGKPMLDQINAGRFFNGGEVSKMDESESSSLGGNTNNINISVNVEKGQEKSQESQSSGDPDQKEQSDDQNQLLAQKIKQQVVAVIVEEQRPGGLLND
jgi:TP901 family phage tail tape measure protein